MAMGRTRSTSLDGLRGRIIEIEVDLSPGLPKTVLVGLPDASLAESRDRCRAAVVNSGASWPDRKVTINLSPAGIPKAGAHYDLGIALAVLAASGSVPAEALHEAVVLGELALDGRLRAVAGVLPATLAAAEAGCERVVVPEANAAEARLVEGIEVVGVRSLRHAAAVLTGEDPPEDDPPVAPLPAPSTPTGNSAERLAALDLSDVIGQDDARAAVIVAASGGHHLLLNGPPGVGKTMLAHRMPALLPDLDRDQSLQTSAVYSVAGLLPEGSPLCERPPFVEPHHTASAAAIVGGGSGGVRPGAMSLAHHGLLFMDEAPEFHRDVLDALRQPLENGYVTISRARQTAEFPARFQLVLAANPCPCGFKSARGNLCECDAAAKRRYTEKLSAPLRDRIDIRRDVVQVSARHLADRLEEAEPTATVAERVAASRDRQRRRWGDTPWSVNAEVPGAVLRKQFPVAPSAGREIETQVRAGRVNPRGADRLLRVAWTIADLRAVSRPDVEEVRVALALRRGTAVDGRLLEMVSAA